MIYNENEGKQLGFITVFLSVLWFCIFTSLAETSLLTCFLVFI